MDVAVSNVGVPVLSGVYVDVPVNVAVVVCDSAIVRVCVAVMLAVAVLYGKGPVGFDCLVQEITAKEIIIAIAPIIFFFIGSPFSFMLCK